MRERVTALGGCFVSGPTEAGGFRVSAVIPAASEWPGPYWCHGGSAEAGAGSRPVIDGGEGLVDVGAEVPVAGVVEAVDAACGVDGEQGLACRSLAEGGRSRCRRARPRSREGAGEVEAGEWVEADR